MACVAVNIGIMSLDDLELVPYSSGRISLLSGEELKFRELTLIENILVT